VIGDSLISLMAVVVLVMLAAAVTVFGILVLFMGL
jgi:hypothetical protein